MDNFSEELLFYKNNPSLLAKNKKHLLKLYGKDGWKLILKAIKPKTQLWKQYERMVRRITEKQPLYLLPNYNLRGFRSYHVDHIIPICQGYKLGISPDIIGHINNLQIIPLTANLKKGKKFDERLSKV